MTLQLCLISIYWIGNIKAHVDLPGAVLIHNQTSRTENMADNADPITRSRVSQLPRHFNLQDEWGSICKSLAIIYDQGRCGSCWAFGTANAMSDRICIQSKGKIQKHVSPQNLLSCCNDCGSCDGGYPHKAYEFWRKEGIVTGGPNLDHWKHGCQPYTIQSCTPDHNPCHEKENRRPTPSCQKKCQSGYNITYESDKTFGKEWRNIYGEEKIKREIYEKGSVSAAMDVYDDFENYKGGIYEKSPTAKEKLSHIVRLVGWGEENGMPFWYGINEWNYFWGERGTFKIRRGVNEVGIESHVIAADPDFYNTGFRNILDYSSVVLLWIIHYVLA